MSGKIYGIRNSKNEKLYIGQTHLSLKERFLRHTADCKTNRNTIISKAIKSIGKEHFEIFLIQDGFVSDEDLNKAEEYYIQKFNTITPNGYNICPGGQKWRRKPNISEKEIQQAITEYESGTSMRELEKKYRTSRQLLSRRIKESGCVVRDKSWNLPDKTSKITRELMEDLYVRKKMMVKDIAEMCGVSVSTINRAKRRYELKR